MNRSDVEVLAKAIHVLRPDWPWTSLVTFITGKLASYAHRDIAVALVWVALDPETKNPGRVLEAGPWWKATRPTPDNATPEPPRGCPDHPDQPRHCPLCAEYRRQAEAARSNVPSYMTQIRDEIRRARPDHTDEQETR